MDQNRQVGKGMLTDKYKLADYIAARYPGEVSPMKLQKLLYYCYVWQLVSGQKHFYANFKAWDYGPVEPDIYKVYKGYNRSPIQAQGGPYKSLPLFDFILDSYAVYSAIELAKTTHKEEPWKKYKGVDVPISDEDILSFYKKQFFAKNFPLANAGKYYPPKTASHYAFSFDMEKDYLPEFKSLQEYLEKFKTEKQRLSRIAESYELQN